MTDIAKRKRTFEVWLDKNVVGAEAEVETVEVPAGEDADEVCSSTLQDIANSIDSGWREVESPKRTR